MLINIKDHLIDKSQVIYISPVKTYRSFSFGLFEIGAYFVVTLNTGDKITIEEVEFPEDKEGFHQFLKKGLTGLYEDLRKEREKLL